jgi:DNA-binding protein HU-beta
VALNRSQLLNRFGELNDLTRKQADELLTSLVEIITASVAAGEDVAISGFAKFRRIDRPARLARNPATGETVKVKAKRVARITPLKSFKDSVLTGKAAKPVSRAPVAPKAPAVKAPAKKTAAKKTAAKKTAAKKPAKKAPAKKTAAKKAPAKKTAARKR